jgi:triacylglycerol esterase/lipase EstA (alpha/beta hydrolase family)
VRTDHDPDLVKRRLLREVGSYVAHGLLYGFGYLPSRHRPLRARDIRTVVFVHGLGGNRASFFPLQTYLSWKGYRRQYAFNYRSRGSIERIAVELKKRLDRDIKGGRIDLVCHSMGGLVGRTYLQQLDGHRRVDHFITLATPHHGSHSSAYTPTQLGSQLKPGGPFLEHLNGLEPPPGVRCTSFASGRDLMVLPPESALAPFGDTEMLPEFGHLDVLLSAKVFRAVLAALEAPIR